MTTEITDTTDLDYLLPALRVQLWDITEPSTYSDGFLKRCLLEGLKLLMSRWSSRYLLSYANEKWSVTRSSAVTFPIAAPPVIQYMDERPIILAASIALKSGIIYMSSFSTASWRDEEISYSNISGSKMAEESLERDWAELSRLLPERVNRLAQSKKQSLLGFRKTTNEFEG